MTGASLNASAAKLTVLAPHGFDSVDSNINTGVTAGSVDSGISLSRGRHPSVSEGVRHNCQREKVAQEGQVGVGSEVDQRWLGRAHSRGEASTHEEASSTSSARSRSAGGGSTIQEESWRGLTKKLLLLVLRKERGTHACGWLNNFSQEEEQEEEKK